MLFNFDLQLVDGQEDWIEKQSQSLIWNKGPLHVRFQDARGREDLVTTDGVIALP